MNDRNAKVTLIATDEYGPAVGTRFLSAVLRNSGFETIVIYARGPVSEQVAKGEEQVYSDEVHDKIAGLAEKSLFVGVSVATPMFHKGREITKQLKQRLDIPVVWGGIHAAVKAEECSEFSDMVCRGDGEQVVCQLARRLQTGASCDDIQGLILSKKDNHQVWAPLTEGNQIPIPDCSLDGSHWVLYQNKLKKITRENSWENLRHFIEYLVAPTRGCPYNCTYCINNLYSDEFGKKRFRQRPLENVIKELVFAKENISGCQRIVIDDDCFMAKTIDEMQQFAKEYKKHVDLPFVIRGAHPATLSETKLEILCDAGLAKLRMGIQTGSDRIRELYGRTWDNNEKILKAASLLNKFIRKGAFRHVVYDVIVDNPWESEDDVYKTLELINSLPRPFSLYVFSLTFYPGTPLYEKALKEGLIQGNSLDKAYYHNFWELKPTPVNQTLDLFYWYNLGNRLVNFMARPDKKPVSRTLSGLLRKILKKLTLRLPELSYFNKSMPQYDFRYRMEFAPRSIPLKVKEINEQQKKEGVNFLVIWLRAFLRGTYRLYYGLRLRLRRKRKSGHK